MKLVYLITCHTHSEFLNFNLHHYLKNFNLTYDDIVISTANKSLDFINKHKFKHFLLHDEDRGYGAGATYNIVKGLEYICNNLEYDYIINIEPDNFFYDYEKMMDIIDEMKKTDKHFLVDIHILQELKIAIKFGTYNIFSKKFMKNYFPFEFCKNITNEPYENFMGNAFKNKNLLNTQEKIREFYNNIGYVLNFEPGKCIYEDDIPYYHADRFEKFGLINAFDNNYKNFLSFLKRRNLIKL